MTSIRYRSLAVDGTKVFYREAGSAGAPKLLLLHGFPTSSHMFRDLIPLLADRFHMVAPDLPGFGLSDSPGRGLTFDRIADTIDRFTEVIGFDRFALYVSTPAPHGLSTRGQTPGADHRHHYAERQRLPGRPQRRLESDPRILGKQSQANRGRPAPVPGPRNHGLAVHARRGGSDRGVSRRLLAGQLLLESRRCRRRPARPVRRLQEQRGPVSEVSELLPRPSAPLLAVWGKNDPFFLPAGAEASNTSIERE